MLIGAYRVTFHVLDAGSLKQKRMVMRSLKDRLLGEFNISCAEIGCQDKWQMGELGIAAVGTDVRHLNSTLENVRQFLIRETRISIVDDDIEII